MSRLVLLVAGAWWVTSAALSCAGAAARFWPTWRGPNHDGVCLDTNVPLEWSSTKNVRWRTALPGPGNSTPIVWGETIILTQSAKSRRGLVAFDSRNGRVRWNALVEEKNATVSSHHVNPPCSSSPVTDGEIAVAWLGSLGLMAVNVNSGAVLWHMDLGRQRHQFGYGSTPIIHGDRVYLNFGPGEREFVAALDKRTGRPVWRLESPTPAAGDIYGTWSTPCITVVDGQPQLLVGLRDYFAGVDPVSGKEIWRCRGIGPQAKSSPIAGEGVAFLAGDLKGGEVAVKLGGTGDVTDTHRLWREYPPRGRVGTGLIHGGHIYGVRANGIIDCVSLETGDEVWAERMPGAGVNSPIWSSPVRVGNLLYIINQGADTLVIRTGPRFDVVAMNPLGSAQRREVCNATLAFANGDIFIRTWAFLWCISTSAPARPPTAEPGEEPTQSPSPTTGSTNNAIRPSSTP
jgi:outer membrane protein assembly factor BamB